MQIEFPLYLVIIAAVVLLLIGGAVGSLIARHRLAGRAALHVEPGGPTPQVDADATGEAPAVRPRAAIIVNPTKPNADKVEANAAAICRQEGWDTPLYIETAADDPGYSMARQALNEKVDLVVAAGGDGTVRAVAEVLSGTDMPMGVIPMGTGNLLARNLGLPLDRDEWALRSALWGADRKLDVGHMTLDGRDRDHAFMVMAGLGFDAAVMGDTDAELKSKFGWLAYLEAGSRKLKGKRQHARIAIDDAPPIDAKIRSVIGGNCGKVQGGLELLPKAKIDDGLLDVLVITPKNMADWLGVAAKLVGKGAGPDKFVKTYQGKTVQIDVDQALPVQLDGDALGDARRVTMWIEAGALTMRVPTAEQTRKMRQELWPLLIGG